jgi:hypothetical protein
MITPNVSIPVGTIRIRTKDLATLTRTPSGWRKSEIDLPDAAQAIHLYKSHGRLDLLVDAKDRRFLKGQLEPDGRALGARVLALPNGRKLNAGFSIFAKNLRFHDEDTDVHWDVMLENPSGFRYLYTLDKIRRAKTHKTHIVDVFARYYPRLKRNVLKDLRSVGCVHSVALYTLMKTYMRVGNEIYYKAHGHKGLTTLQKKDIAIQGHDVLFNYRAKDGVPMHIRERFPDVYIRRLDGLLTLKKPEAFVFSHESGHPMDGKEIKKSIEDYCGKGFFPHIIRSYYADTEVKKFFRRHRTATKEEVFDLLIMIAAKLGHRRFMKKEHAWVESPKVTVNNYIRPEFVERLHAYYSRGPALSRTGS